MYEEEVIKEEKCELSKKKKGKTHTHEVRLGWSTLFVRVRNPLLQDRLIVRILKNVLKPLRG